MNEMTRGSKQYWCNCFERKKHWRPRVNQADKTYFRERQMMVDFLNENYPNYFDIESLVSVGNEKKLKDLFNLLKADKGGLE
jgi:hypothetical protein